MSLSPAANKTDWRALLLGLFLAVSALALLGFSSLTLLMAAGSISSPDGSMLLILLLLAAGLFCSALLLIPGAYLNGRKFFNLPDVQIKLPHVNEAALFMV